MYCDSHTCAFSQCASWVLGPPFLFCNQHKCSKTDCLNSKAVGSPSQGLASLALFGAGGSGQTPSVANFLMPVGMYCAVHKCEAVECSGLAIDGGLDGGGGGQFCAAHQCREQGCGFRIASAKSAYCAVHECGNKECRRPLVPDSGGLCEMHSGDEFGGGGVGDNFWGGTYGGGGGHRKSLYPPLRW